jgi:hypothetical protein
VTAQHVHQVPVTARPEVQDRLRQAADEMSTSEVTAYARTQGVIPPTNDPSRDLLPRFEPDGSDGPLMWVLVTEPTDD